MFKKLAKHGVIVVIILIALAVLLAKGFTRVPVGSTGIMVTLGRVQDGSTLSEGLHFHLPFLQDIVTMDNRVQKLELDTEAFSKAFNDALREGLVNLK